MSQKKKRNKPFIRKKKKADKTTNQTPVMEPVAKIAQNPEQDKADEKQMLIITGVVVIVLMILLYFAFSNM